MARTWKEDREKIIERLAPGLNAGALPGSARTWLRLPELAEEALRKGTAEDRHRSRVDAVLAACLADPLQGEARELNRAGVGASLDWLRQRAAAHFGYAIAAEALAAVRKARAEIRIVRGTPTRVRPGWGASLGKGRPNATDGEAWSGALLSAEQVLDSVRIALGGPSTLLVDDAEHLLDLGDAAWRPAIAQLGASVCRSNARAVLDGSMRAIEEVVDWIRILARIEGLDAVSKGLEE